MSTVLAHSDPAAAGRSPPPAFPGKWYLCHFAHKLLEFRQPEVESLACLEGCPPSSIVWRQPPSSDPIMMPFWQVCLPSDDVARRIASRAMLSKGFYELWGEGSTWEELEASVRSYPTHLMEPWMQADQSFKIQVESYGSKLAMKEQVELLERLHFLPFKGPVDLRKPDVKMWLMVVDVHQQHGLGDTNMVPYRLYFGRQVAVYSHMLVNNTYLLSTRPYIGPTSMDAEMAFIMCNQAKVASGGFVLDPYVGTGSIALAAAHQGAQVMGADIDARVVRLGKVGPQGEHLDVYANFSHYGTQGRLAGLLRLDMHVHPFRGGLEEVFHAIVGDPPYGVRAGGRKSRSAVDIEIRDLSTHITGTDPYSLGECLRDLLDFSARTLTVGGRLVYFLPASYGLYSEEEIPTHPGLALLYNSEQILTSKYSRRLLTYEKVCVYDAGAAAAHHAANPDPSLRIDTLSAVVLPQPVGGARQRQTKQQKRQNQKQQQQQQQEGEQQPPGASEGIGGGRQQRYRSKRV